MDQVYIYDKVFEKINFNDNLIVKGEYDHCTFKHCDLSNADLSNFKFINCEFLFCNLSLTKLFKTMFSDVKFKDCKMLGFLYHHCNPFGVGLSFENCNLNHSSFYKAKIQKTSFKSTQLNEVDFTDSDLSQSLFENCDLLNAKFENTILEKTDLRTSYNYLIDPEINKIKKAKFALRGLPGLLSKYNIDIDFTN